MTPSHQSSTAARGRPSLVDHATADHPKNPPLSILAALGGQVATGVPAERQRAWPWALGLGTLVMALLAAATLHHTGERAISPVTAAMIEPPPLPLSLLLPLPLAASQAAPAPAMTPPAAATQLATLAALEALPAPLADTGMAAPPADGPKRSPDATNMVRAPTASSSTPGKQATRSTTRAGAGPTARGRFRAGTAVRAPATAARGGAASAKPSLGTDADVDLIAALVQHMNRRDTAARGAGSKVDDRMARCAALPAEDARRCQRRICDSNGARVEACPHHRAPRGAAARP